LEKTFGSIADMTRQPAAIFIVDILKEHIALKEARRLNIPVFAMVDTNVNPKMVDFPIPANDDATKSIAVILEAATDAIKAGLAERKANKDSDDVKAAADKKAAKEEAPAEEVPVVEAAPAVEEAKTESQDSTEEK
jgi:small subunit ribosomal protein S2